MAEDDWELTPATAHPAARAAMAQDFFWDPVDENSPFGNDTGADVLAFFREWHDGTDRGSAVAFLADLLARWEVADAHWDASDAASVQELIRSDEFSFTHRDDAIIALALAQLALDGEVEVPIRDRALLALKRQLLPSAIALWPSEHHDERRERVAIMARVLAGAGVRHAQEPR